MDVSYISEKKLPKVLFAITQGTWGGAQKYVYDLATVAQNKGFEVVVVYGVPGILIEKLDLLSIRTIALPKVVRAVEITSDLKSLATFIQILREERPDVLHINSSKIGVLGSLAGRIARVPKIIFTSHGWAFNELRPLWQKRLFWLAQYMTVLLSHTTICVSSAIKRDAKKMLFVQQKFVVIHNGIEPKTLLSKETSRSKLIPHAKEKIWLGSIAELHPTKNLSVLLRAFAKIERDDVLLIIMGEGICRQELVELSSTLQIQNNVHFLGHVENASTYLPALDIFVLPSRSEALGYVLLEAGLARLPVIATRVGGIPEIIENTVTGLLVPQGEAVPLKEALVKLLKDTTIQNTLGTALYKKVTEEFSLEQMVAKTFLLYQ